MYTLFTMGWLSDLVNIVGWKYKVVKLDAWVSTYKLQYLSKFT